MNTAISNNQTGMDFPLDAAQEQAVSFLDGPCAVIAGPGSGKTAVITRRVLRLIEHGISPGNILTITFTKAAAYEMQSRFLKLSGGRCQEAVFGTFHSVFYNMLAQSSKTERVSFIGLKEKKAMMEHVLRERSLRFSAEVTESLLRAVSRVKNLGLTGTDRIGSQSHVPFAGRFPELFFAYEDIRRSLNRMDYDDIAPACLALLNENHDLLETWRKRFCYIQIDEFQDVNPVQYELALLLAKGRNNLFAVGDDDQSVYGFRGATPDVLQRMFRDLPDTKRIILNTNFRSDAAVIRAAGRLIAGNQNRIAKKPCPSAHAGEGLVRQTVYPERSEELRALSEAIRQQIADGSAPGSVAVLYRTSFDAMRVSLALKEAGVPFRMTEKLQVPFTESAAEDVLAYLRFAVLGAHRSDFLRILNKPVRFLSRNCAEKETVREQDVLAYYGNSPVNQKAIRQLFLDIRRIAHLKTHLAIGYVLQATGYERHLRKETDAEGFARAQEVLSRMRELAGQHTDIRSFLDHIALLQDLARESRTEGGNRAGTGDGVRLMTMHASKGLEFDTVFLPLLNEGIMPQIRAVTDTETEEERRLLYVAMTRAKRCLYLSCAEKDGTKRLLRSRFLTK